ncbi:lysophospholipid acyltransferase family protein [Aurantibacter sp.]|uniref:lysophospholipid acyltransferase family protein n=1 Tax=Aurantibacter sp. TaxID=2807103 RepID=UPI0035C7D876
MQLVVYVLAYPFLWLISILPFRLLYAFSDFMCFLVYDIVGYRKKVVYENLTLVFPEKTDKEKKIIMRKFYHHFCDMMLEAIKSMTISEAKMKKHFTFSNIELINDLEAKDRSVILMCSHYGSWEWIFIMQSYCTHQGYAIYKRIANPYFDKMFKRIRAKYNSYLITTKETIPTLIRAKRDGIKTINGFVSDQSPKLNRAFYWRNFMGIKVPVHTGAEVLAKKLDMSVVFFNVKRIKRGYYECTFKTLAEHPKEFEDFEITDKFIELAETDIYNAPQYYLWTHKRWKHRDKVPPEFK